MKILRVIAAVIGGTLGGVLGVAAWIGLTLLGLWLAWLLLFQWLS